MELYQLECVLHEPCEDQGWLYMAETPELPGCRAWGGDGQRCTGGTIRSGGAVHPLLQIPEQIPAGRDNPVPGRRGQNLRGIMTYGEPTRKLRWLGCSFDRQAGAPMKYGSTRPTIRKPLFQGTATGTWPREPSMESGETWASPGKNSTACRNRKPPDKETYLCKRHCTSELRFSLGQGGVCQPGAGSGADSGRGSAA